MVKPTLEQLKVRVYDLLVVQQQVGAELNQVNNLIANYNMENITPEVVEPVEAVVEPVEVPVVETPSEAVES